MLVIIVRPSDLAVLTVSEMSFAAPGSCLKKVGHPFEDLGPASVDDSKLISFVRSNGIGTSEGCVNLCWHVGKCTALIHSVNAGFCAQHSSVVKDATALFEVQVVMRD